jgi:DNA modification methylase
VQLGNQNGKIRIKDDESEVRFRFTKEELGSTKHDDGFEPEVYWVWNFGKAMNEVRHFGNIPPEIIDNLLYYYTSPGDVVFDPFAGGGSTIDVCRRRFRRYFACDLTPIEERKHEIRQHDITSGLPKQLLVPDLVFLDPPYWKQAQYKYSSSETDLANVDLDTFLDTIENIAKLVKRKWTKEHNGKLALIIGPWKQDGKDIDLAFLCYQRILEYLSFVKRIIVPYSTQVHGGAFVKKAQEDKDILYLYRDLSIFGL